MDNIAQFIGKVVTIRIDHIPTKVRLVDGEVFFNQPGLSAGFVHFADPHDEEVCLGFAGINTVYDLIHEQPHPIVKDIFENTLAVGDVVAFTEPGYTYTLMVGTIIKFTPKKLVVEWDYRSQKRQTYKFPCQVAKK